MIFTCECNLCHEKGEEDREGQNTFTTDSSLHFIDKYLTNEGSEMKKLKLQYSNHLNTGFIWIPDSMGVWY